MSPSSTLLVLLAGFVFFAWLVASVAQSRGHSYWGFFFASLLLSPVIALGVVLLLPGRSEVGAGQAQRLDRLQQLVRLRDAGALTADEFAHEKQFVLRGTTQLGSQADGEVTDADAEDDRSVDSDEPEQWTEEELEAMKGPIGLVIATMRKAIGDSRAFARAGYRSLDGGGETVGRTVLTRSSVVWAGAWPSRPAGIVVAIADRLLWSTSRFHRLGADEFGEEVTIRELSYDDLLAAGHKRGRRAQIYIDAGPTLEFELDSDEAASDLAERIDRLLTQYEAAE